MLPGKGSQKRPVGKGQVPTTHLGGGKIDLKKRSTGAKEAPRKQSRPGERTSETHRGLFPRQPKGEGIDLNPNQTQKKKKKKKKKEDPETDDQKGTDF